MSIGIGEVGGHQYEYQYVLDGAGVNIHSTSETAEVKLSLQATGNNSNGQVDLSANGAVSARVGDAGIQVSKNSSGKETVGIDAGPTGIVEIASGNPVTPQRIVLNGTSNSILLSNGVSGLMPQIELTPASIKLSCGPACSIELTATGIKINGMMIDITGVAQATLAAPMVQIKGDAMTEVKGAIVMIN